MIDPISSKAIKLTLGELCKRKKQTNGLYQEDLAHALGLSRYTFQNFEMVKIPH